MKTLHLFLTLLTLNLFADIDSGGGFTSVGQFTNHSSIGGYIESNGSTSNNYNLYNGQINIIFISSLTEEEVDVDNDGIPDDWESIYGLSTTQDNSNFDSDSDGFLDLSEFIAGTNPNDSNSFLSILISYENGVYNISFDSIEGRTYSLEVSQDLNDFYFYNQTNGNGNLISIPFDPLDEANTTIFGNNNLENIFFRLIVQTN